MVKKILLAVVALVVVVGFAFGIKNKISSQNSSFKNAVGEKTQELTNFKLALSATDTTSTSIIKYGEERGFFQKNGIEIELVQAAKTPFEPVVGGRADAMFATLTRPISSYFNGVESRLLANGYEEFMSFVLSRYAQGDASKIKRVAIKAAGSESQQLAKIAMKNLGLDPEKIEYISADSGVAELAMLQKGDVDFAVFLNETEIKKEEREKYLTFDRDMIFHEDNATFARSIISTKEMIDKDPAKIQKFITAFRETLVDIQGNKNSFVAFIEKELQMSDEDANVLHERLSSAIGKVSFVPSLDLALSTTADDLKKDSQNPERSLADFVYPVFAEKAIGEK